MDQVKLQEDLDRLQEWERDWLMEFNPIKCEVNHDLLYQEEETDPWKPRLAIDR